MRYVCIYMYMYTYVCMYMGYILMVRGHEVCMYVYVYICMYVYGVSVDGARA